MPKYFATKSRNLHLNRGANGDAIGSPFKCKVPFGKPRGPAQAPNRRTSHINDSIPAPLTGCFRPAIKKFVEAHRSFINQANNTHGLGPGHNRGKARVDPDAIPVLVPRESGRFIWWVQVDLPSTSNKGDEKQLLLSLEKLISNLCGFSIQLNNKASLD
jgi:hypothetical protein